MSNRYSVFLDLIRFLAALSVAFFHFSYTRFTDGALSFIEMSSLGHNAVVIFFVLSGFVIYFSVNQKHVNLFDYLSKRFVRLYSVLIPALFVGVILDTFGSGIYHSIYDGKIVESNLEARFLINFLFLQEIQFYSFRFLSNGPLWSLGYEFWYYVLFGFAFFIKMNVVRIISVVAVSILVGLKIILLLPIWLLGVFIYRMYEKGYYRSSLFSWAGLLVSFFLFFALTFLDVGVAFRDYSLKLGKLIFPDLELGYSSLFFHDYVLGVFFSFFLLSSANVLERVNFSSIVFRKKMETLIRSVAGSTLTLYLFHFPLLLFFYALFNYFGIETNFYIDAFIFSLVVCVSYVFSLIIESRSGFLYIIIKSSVERTLIYIKRFFFISSKFRGGLD